MKLAIIGAGGHGREIAAIARSQYDERLSISFWDDALSVGEYDFGRVEGRIDDLRPERASHFVIGIGDPATRASVSKRYEFTDIEPAVLTHTSAVIGDRCMIGPGSVVGPGSVITCDTSIGAHTHIHANAIISHDSRLEDFVTVTPGVTLAGDVTIREMAWLGVGCTVNRGIQIGRSALVGAGAVVLADVSSDDVVAGVPARSLNPERQR